MSDVSRRAVILGTAGAVVGSTVPVVATEVNALADDTLPLRRNHTHYLYFAITELYFWQIYMDPRKKGESIESFLDRNDVHFRQLNRGISEQDHAKPWTRDELVTLVAASAAIDPTGPYAEGGSGIRTEEESRLPWYAGPNYVHRDFLVPGTEDRQIT